MGAFLQYTLFSRLKSDVAGTTLLDIEARYNKNNFILKTYANVEEMKFDIVMKASTQWGKCKGHFVFKTVASICCLFSKDA